MKYSELLEQMSITRLWSWDQLTAEEKSNVGWAIGQVRKHVGVEFELEVVDFKHEVAGCFWRMYHGRNNLIRLARKHAGNRQKTIMVIVHEISHVRGRDFTVAHRNACEELFSKIIDDLSNQSEA